MARFNIKHGLFLKSANKLLMPKTLFITEEEAQLKELREVYAPHGAAEEVVAVESTTEVSPPADSDPPTDPADDISLAKGIGARAIEKLATAEITTLSGLKAAMLSPEKEEEMKALLGANHGKVLANFVEAPAAE